MDNLFGSTEQYLASTELDQALASELRRFNKELDTLLTDLASRRLCNNLFNASILFQHAF